MQGATTPPDSGYCSAEVEDVALACSRGAAWRRGDTLFVRRDSGTTLTLVARDGMVNGVESNDQVAFEYVGRISAPVGAYHLVRQRLYETSSLEAISAHTGATYVLGGVPLLAPDHVRLAAASPIEDCDAGNTVLEVWRLGAERAVREFQLFPYDCSHEVGWGPTDVAWQSPDSLRFTANEVIAGGVDSAGAGEERSHRVRRVPALLVRTVSGWKVVGASPTRP